MTHANVNPSGYNTNLVETHQEVYNRFTATSKPAPKVDIGLVGQEGSPPCIYIVGIVELVLVVEE